MQSTERPRADAVDVVVTVYGALDYVRACLESLRRHSDGFQLRVIVVDDGSGPVTVGWLKGLAASWPELLVIEHERNLGYTRAVNTGLRASEAAWVVVLNSDTVVSEGWLAGMLRCAVESKAGLVGPLSNAASWQSVPHVFDADGAFAVNVLPPDLDPDGMASLVRAASKHRYPRVPVLNGFCLLLRREVLERVGLMDEFAFSVGYGEENDYCIRAANAGFALAVADDAFVFHAKSKSFGHAQRIELSNRGAQTLATKHGQARVSALGREIGANPELRAVRAAVQAALAERRERVRLDDPLALRVLFLLPVLGASGGAHSVVLEAAEMTKLGVFVRVGVPPRALGDLGAIYADVPNVRQLLVAAHLERVVELARDFDVVVATAAHSMEWVARIVAAHPHILPAYYVQDYEPWFSTEGSAEARAAAASYTRVEGALLFVKTQFLARTLQEQQGIEAKVVEPSLDHATYYPVEGAARARVRVTAMVRPQTPRRGAPRTMRVLRELVHQHGEQLEIHVFGCADNDERFKSLERRFAFVNHGVLRRPEVAELLRNSELFVDLSDYQAFGRTALEAMASGCVPVVPVAGGGCEFAVDGHNALLVDTTNERACAERVSRLIATSDQRNQMRRAALATAAKFSLRGAAQSVLQVMATATVAWRATHPYNRHCKRLMLVNLASTSRGHLAVSAPLGAWKLPAVQREWTVTERNRPPKPGSAEVAIVLLGLAGTNWDELSAWFYAWRRAHGRVVVHVDLGEDVEPVPAWDTRTRVALSWLSEAADALTVSNAASQRALAAARVDATLVAPVLDPIVWRLGPAARRPTWRWNARAAAGVGVLAQSAHPALIAAVEGLKEAQGERIVIETLSAHPGLARLGRRLSIPTARAEAELAEWAFDHLEWDIALAHESDSRRLLECTALGVPVVKVGHDTAEAIRLVTALLEDAPERARRATEALAGLEENAAGVELSGSLAQLLDACMTRPAKADLPELPDPLRGLAGKLLPRWRQRSFEADSGPESFPKARSKTRRKLDKLRRDPGAFLRDSKVKLNLDALRRRLGLLK